MNKKIFKYSMLILSISILAACSDEKEEVKKEKESVKEEVVVKVDDIEGNILEEEIDEENNTINLLVTDIKDYRLENNINKEDIDEYLQDNFRHEYDMYSLSIELIDFISNSNLKDKEGYEKLYKNNVDEMEKIIEKAKKDINMKKESHAGYIEYIENILKYTKEIKYDDIRKNEPLKVIKDYNDKIVKNTENILKFKEIIPQGAVIVQ